MRASVSIHLLLSMLTLVCICSGRGSLHVYTAARGFSAPSTFARNAAAVSSNVAEKGSSISQLDTLSRLLKTRCGALYTKVERGACSQLDSLSRSICTLSKHSNSSSTGRRSIRVLQVQIVHRHGDRTPITPLQNETFWASTLPPEALLDKLARQTRVIRDASKPNTHKAGGRGPFGKLTQLGLLQMVELGTKLKQELVCDKEGHAIDDDGHVYFHHGRLFHSSLPLTPQNVQVISTDFPRTIQSVQGVLVGLFDDGHNDVIDIDARHTSNLIPDPQPRRSKEQEELELKLAARPHLQKREEEMKGLAIRTTEVLKPLLGNGAFDVSFGVGEEKTKTSHHHHLAWTQLSEITKCLQVRNMLPPSITDEDQEAISSHAAWKWMDCLRHPRLAYLAMHPMTSAILESMKRRLEGHDVPPLTIYSAHDSTLIGLLCAFRLEQPSKWPGYGEYLKVELIECEAVDSQGEASEKEHYVRFSLSGNVLRSQWDPEDEPAEVITLNDIAQKIATSGDPMHHSKHHSGN